MRRVLPNQIYSIIVDPFAGGHRARFRVDFLDAAQVAHGTVLDTGRALTIPVRSLGEGRRGFRLLIEADGSSHEPPTRAERARVNSQMREAARLAETKGLSEHALAEHFGMNVKTIRRWLDLVATNGGKGGVGT